MDDTTRTHWNNLRSDDGDVRYAAFMALLAITDEPVDWAYEVWNELLANLRHKDNHQRAIAAQLLSNLAKSDPEQRMLKDFDALFAVTRDERFVSARHSLQAIWKVALAGKQHQQMVVERLASRFRECVTEKNATLIRYDISDDLRKLYDVVQDETVRETALALIATEEDSKYRKKYAGVWRFK
jgi:HEAT repeat protein